MKRVWSLVAAIAAVLVPVHAAGAQKPSAPAYEEDAKVLAPGAAPIIPSYDRFGQGEDVDAALVRLNMLAASTTDPLEFYRAVPMSPSPRAMNM